MTQGQERRKLQQMNEAWNLWLTCLQIIERRGRKYHKLLGFHQHHCSVFQMICRKERFVPGGSLSAWLLKRNRNAWKYNITETDLTLKVKHSFIELSLWTKRGLDTLNWIWNHNQMSGEGQSLCNPKDFDERNLRWSKWWSLLVITEELSCGTSVTAVYYRDWLQKLRRKIHKNWRDLLGDGPLIFAQHSMPVPGEGCYRFAK
jgi:hypothetical protein